MRKQSCLDQLIYLFSKLPGLGNRSARRIVLHLLQDKDLRLGALIRGLEEASHQLTNCQICGNIDYTTICSICSAESRNDTIIAVVETVAELWAIERSAIFCGKYHVLGASISASNNRNSTDLRLSELLDRCDKNKTEELIIATNSTLEGQTTAYFITEYFKDRTINISRLASGIPIGGELDYLDEGTLTAALESRRKFN
jgi:recombination protein RecR